jgi:hypothetical protein
VHPDAAVEAVSAETAAAATVGWRNVVRASEDIDGEEAGSGVALLRSDGTESRSSVRWIFRSTNRRPCPAAWLGSCGDMTILG